MVNRPVDSSIRSKQTGHVGSSMRAGVGGGGGLELKRGVVLAVKGCFAGAEDEAVLGLAGVKGSFVRSGNETSWVGSSRSRYSIDLTKTIWKYSG